MPLSLPRSFSVLAHSSARPSHSLGALTSSQTRLKSSLPPPPPRHIETTLNQRVSFRKIDTPGPLVLHKVKPKFRVKPYNSEPQLRIHIPKVDVRIRKYVPRSTMPPIDTEALKAHVPIVISGPSGAGKSTILKRLFEEFPDKFGFSVSHTTRSPRAGEEHGREYNFVSQEEFLKLIDEKGFVEHAQFGGNRYGTSIKAIETIAEKGRICILDIEMEGVKQVANHPTFPRPRFLFLSPPSMEILEKRLRSRATDKEADIQKRLNQAKVEMEFAQSGEAPHDKVVVNDDLDKAYKEVRDFIVETDA